MNKRFLAQSGNARDNRPYLFLLMNCTKFQTGKLTNTRNRQIRVKTRGLKNGQCKIPILKLLINNGNNNSALFMAAKSPISKTNAFHNFRSFLQCATKKTIKFVSVCFLLFPGKCNGCSLKVENRQIIRYL
jgi:hypothetical protein